MSVVSTMNSKRATDEVRHANDELEHFYLEAKRNRKIANWASKKLGRDKKEYFLELISADLTRAGPKPVVDRILDDFKQAGLDIDENRVWDKVRRFEREIFTDMMTQQAERTKAEIKAREKKARKKKKK
jgi:hypothetical protein